MDPWKTGTSIGPYVLLSRLGSGGSGDVWKASDTRLERVVAIKRLRDPSFAFEREARAIAALNHPHVCTLYDIGSDYLVMECVEGTPLTGPMDPADAVPLALQITAALQMAHQRGIIHRDLKPSNILVADGRAKLLDFGIAKLLSRADAADATLTVDGTISGTPAYMAPEQAMGDATDARSDIFSFGAVLYQMLSGRGAFERGSTAETLTAVLRDEPPPIHTSETLRRIVRTCLEKSPTRRYQSVAELRMDLEGALNASEDVPSIAVLPFANMSSDPEQEYFSDGLTEEIINALAQVPGLKVIARTSAFAFKGQNVQIGTIAQALGVSSVLEGSVRRSGQRIRVTAQLISTTDGCPLWSERYDRDLADVFAVQDDIASAIVRELRGRLVTEAGDRPAYRPSVPAYEAFLMARHHVWRHSADSLAQGMAFYEQAIALDPGYADPHVGIAELLHIRASFRGPAAQEAARGIRPALEQALALDPAHPEANAWLGILASTYEYNWKEAGERFRAITASEPISPRVRHLDAYFRLRLIGQADQAVEAHHRALQDDPLNLIMRVGLAASLTSAGKHAEAAREGHRLLELAPDFAPTYTLLALDVARTPLPVALSYAERLHARMPECAGAVGLYAGLLCRVEEETRGRALLSEIGSAAEYGNAVDFALFCLARGETDAAFEHLVELTKQRHPLLMMVLIGGPYGETLRSSAHWPALARATGLG